jgi:hypothetical protein
MSVKRPSLSAAPHEASGRRAASLAIEQEPALPATAGAITTTRHGTKTISGHFDPVVSRQLKQIRPRPGQQCAGASCRGAQRPIP